MDLAAASSFLAAHGRVLERRRLAFLLGHGPASAVVDALEAYRNADGGYGWGLEPDLRDAGSQPACAMHALEAIGELGVAVPQSVALLDWLASVSRPDGSLPFALPVADPAGCAPWWLGPDAPGSSSLQMTTQVAAVAIVVGRHDPAVAGHPWLAAATSWCLDAIRSLAGTPHAYELLFALKFLDALGDAELLGSMAPHLPPDGRLAVEGGLEGESLRPTDLPPGARALLEPAVVADDLARLDAEQQADGGWTVDFASSSPAGALEWRGIATVRAVQLLMPGRAP